jgi:HAMP domain-containing protein
MLSWMLVIVTLGLYVVSMMPYQRATAIGRMRFEAHGIAASIGEVTAHAIILEDYSFAVDHCTKVLSKSASIRYVVITKRDGFSLIHTADAWRKGQLGGIWTPSDDASQEGRFIDHELVGDEVFHYSYPLSYSGIDWGWIHIGLSLEPYHADRRNGRARTLLVAAGCISVGLFASLLFARRLSRPILSLSEAAQQIAAGDLSTRAHVSTGDEVERLAHAFNRMAAALQKAHDELEMRVRKRTEALAKANEALQGEIDERKRRKRMEEELRRQAALDRVRAEMFAMRGAEDLERSLSTLEQELRTIIDFCACSVQIVSDPGSFTAYTMELGRLRKKEALSLPQEGPAHEAWTTGHPVYRRDLEKEDHFGERETLEEEFSGEGIRAAVDAPFSQGTLSVYSVHPDPFPEKDIETLSAFAAVLSEGLSRIESLEQIERQNRRLSVLNEIGNSLSSTLNFDELLHRAYEQLE